MAKFKAFELEITGREKISSDIEEIRFLDKKAKADKGIFSKFEYKVICEKGSYGPRLVQKEEIYYHSSNKVCGSKMKPAPRKGTKFYRDLVRSFYFVKTQ